MNNLIAILAIVYGVGYYTVSHFYVIPMNWPQIIVAIVGGVGLLLWHNRSLLKMSNFTSSPSKNRGNIYTPEAFEKKDFECLIHLRDRLAVAKSTEGLKVINELNSIIFALHEKDHSSSTT